MFLLCIFTLIANQVCCLCSLIFQGAFFSQHGVTTKEVQQKYNARAAVLYREKVAMLAMQAMKTHGTKLHLDTVRRDSGDAENERRAATETDFFAHTETEFAKLGVKDADVEDAALEKAAVSKRYSTKLSISEDSKACSSFSPLPTFSSFLPLLKMGFLRRFL